MRTTNAGCDTTTIVLGSIDAALALLLVFENPTERTGKGP